MISSCQRCEGSVADTSDEDKINSHSNNFPVNFFPLVYLSLIYKNSVSFLFFLCEKELREGLFGSAWFWPRRAAGSLQYVRQASGSPTEGMKDNPQQLTAGSGVDGSAAQLQESPELTQHQSCEGMGRDGGVLGEGPCSRNHTSLVRTGQGEGSPEPE